MSSSNSVSIGGWRAPVIHVRRAVSALAILGVLATAGCQAGESSAADSTEAARTAARAVVLSEQDVAVAKVADVTTGVLLTGSL